MSALKLDVRRWENVVAIKVLEQSGFLRGKKELASIPRMKLFSSDYPQVSPKRLHIQGFIRERDDDVVSYTFKTVREAEEYVNNVRLVVADLNRNHRKETEKQDDFGCKREIMT